MIAMCMGHDDALDVGQPVPEPIEGHFEHGATLGTANAGIDQREGIAFDHVDLDAVEGTGRRQGKRHLMDLWAFRDRTAHQRRLGSGSGSSPDHPHAKTLARHGLRGRAHAHTQADRRRFVTNVASFCPSPEDPDASLL